jgi:hypothetical protein
MGIKGDCWASGASIVSDLGRFWPICCVGLSVDFSLSKSCFCLMVMSLKLGLGIHVRFFVPHLVPNHPDLLHQPLWLFITTRYSLLNYDHFPNMT